MDINLFIVIILIILGIFGLIVGVSNDAVNFLNSSIGSMVAPIRIIMLISGLGILAGVTFSSGMMEVARKGIFHPKYFTMPELMVIFLSVMLANVLLLDLFNTFGLPTSTTVAIVFSLLGGAVGMSLIKIVNSNGNYSKLVQYINTGKALTIIMGIILSVGIAFFFGVVVQFVTRFIFTFDYQKRIKRYGALWSGTALSVIVYFILIKGAKGSSFITPEMMNWIKTHTILILLINLIFWAIVFALIQLFTSVNILVPVVLIGTFALAMAFAANDLVNFIGVPLAALHSYIIASSSSDPAGILMEALQKPVQTDTIILLFSGSIMAVTLWFSKKAQTVAKTEVSLGRQDEGTERFNSSPVSRGIVRMVASMFNLVKAVIPEPLEERISRRLDIRQYKPDTLKDGRVPSFDLIRASVNLVVASAVVSFATSMKLPLSTTYVTFMVAMGTSLSDQAWDRESAVYRVSGVLTVIAGWFMTAVIAFSFSLALAYAIFYLKIYAILAVLIVAGLFVYHNHHLHLTRAKMDKEMEIFNLIKIDDTAFAVKTTFEHSGIFLNEVRKVLSDCFDGLFAQNRHLLKKTKDSTKKIQIWANIIIANIFKTMRSLHLDDIEHTKNYAHTIGALQEIAESVRDTIMRCYLHVENNHKGLLEVQIEELKLVKKYLMELLDHTSKAVHEKNVLEYHEIEDINTKLKETAAQLDENQIKRIQDETSKTRLSILFYGIIGDSLKISEQTINLLNIFRESFKAKLTSNSR